MKKKGIWRGSRRGGGATAACAACAAWPAGVSGDGVVEQRLRCRSSEKGKGRTQEGAG